MGPQLSPKQPQLDRRTSRPPSATSPIKHGGFYDLSPYLPRRAEEKSATAQTRQASTDGETSFGRPRQVRGRNPFRRLVRGSLSPSAAQLVLSYCYQLVFLPLAKFPAWQMNSKIAMRQPFPMLPMSPLPPGPRVALPNLQHGLLSPSPSPRPSLIPPCSFLLHR